MGHRDTAQVLDQARLRGRRRRAAARTFGDAIGSAELVEAREPCRAPRRDDRVRRLRGRPLFAGHAAVAWPDEPHVVLWHAQTLLAPSSTATGAFALARRPQMTGVEALVVHGATGEVPDVAVAVELTGVARRRCGPRAVGGLQQRGRSRRRTDKLTRGGPGPPTSSVEDQTRHAGGAPRTRVSDGRRRGDSWCSSARRFSRMVVDGGLLAAGARQPDGLRSGR